MLLQALGILGGLISFIGYIPYVKDILKLKAQPERATWFIWSVLTAIQFFSQQAEGATNSLWLNGLDSFGAIGIFIISIKFGVGGLVRRDLIALVAAAVGLFLWYLTSQPFIALVITIGIDIIGTVLTVTKTYEDPATETYTIWVLGMIGGLLAALSVGRLDPTLLVYPIYFCLADLSVVLAKRFGRKL
ncbi:MAG TPA: hypothetical protein VNX65_00590 [Patescibacteria group bacterium]|jgi:hypothetical protein|nr:hypothetical protein [Patescibacteria group bacterium]